MQDKIKWHIFLKDVLWCALGSYGGPEAHYGVFSSILVDKKKYLTEEELTEMIGLYTLVPGPSSTQTITAIGYFVGGPMLALLTFLVWALPAILIMGFIGVFFHMVNQNDFWKPMIKFLPALAVSFIIFAAFSLSKKVIKKPIHLGLFIVMLVLGIVFVPYSVWVVPILLVLGGMILLIPEIKQIKITKIETNPRWWILAVVLGLAIINELLISRVHDPMITLYTSFYRYGYSVIGGGQIVIPLMIQDLVQNQTLILIEDFLAGYAIDQAIPGPLFSFAAFVSSRAYADTGFSFLAGLIGGLSIFIPGILFVFFMYPLWHQLRELTLMKYFLKGVSVTAGALITMTAITQTLLLPNQIPIYAILIVSTLLLLTKKIPAPLIVVLAMLIGYVL